MDSHNRAKSMAKALRKALAERGVYLPHSACLEMVAGQLGYRDWNTLSAACAADMSVSMTIFVEHGREEEAASFYEAAFGAARTGRYGHDGVVTGFDLRLGDRIVSLAGSNPRREADPERGGPFFPKGRGAVGTIFRLDVADAAGVVARAVAAGAIVRDRLQVSADGHRAASVFDPFGHIWGVRERRAA